MKKNGRESMVGDSLPHEIVGGYCIKYAYLPKIAFKVESDVEHPKEYRR